MVNNQGSIERKHRIYIAGVAFILFFIMAAGIFTFLTSYSTQSVGFTLAYVAGLSMIFLPCTLPLVFFIAPIAMNESPVKGTMMALLFGAGMMITFGIYGIAFASIGEINAVLTANMIAGIVGGGLLMFFGLYELGLVETKPRRLGFKSSNFIQKYGDYFKVFLIGFFLANNDVLCPNPIFYVLLAYISTAGIFTGWSIVAVYGTGKATSMIFFAILGILGINAAPGIKKIIKVNKAIDWGLIFAGAFLLTIGGPFHELYDESAIHEAWNNKLITLTDGRIGEVETVSPELHDVLKTVPQWFGLYVFILLLAIPLILHFYRKGKLEFVGVSRKQKLSKKIRDA